MLTPEMRASLYLTQIRVLRETPLPAADAALREAAEAVARVERQGSMSWLPAKDFLPICRAVRLSFQGKELTDYWHRNALATMGQPILRGGMQFMLKITGGRKSVVKSIQNSWSLISRNCGNMRAGDTTVPHRMVVHWENIPPQLASEPAYWESFPISFEATFDTLKMPATVQLEMSVPNGSGIFTFDWQDAA